MILINPVRQLRTFLLREKLFEYLGIIFGEVGENFPVEFDILLFKLVDEFAVACPVLSGGGIYLYLPEPSEIPLVFLPVGELE